MNTVATLDVQRLPPHSVEAEQSLLGGLLLDNQAMDNIADVVTEENFYRDDHRRIFHHINSLIQQNQPADIVSVYETIVRHGDEQRTGGMAYLGAIANSTPSAANIRHYAHIIRQYAVLRQLVTVGEGIATAALNPGGRTAEQILDQAESDVFQIAERGKSAQMFQHIGDILPEVFDNVQHLAQAGSHITGVATGFEKLDQATSGFQPGDLIIIAGRPSMGKSSLAMNIAERVCIKDRLPVAVFSMEMSASQLAMRLLASICRIDLQKVRKGQLRDQDWSGLTDGMSQLKDVPLFIDETSNINPLELRARTRRLAKRYGKLGMVIVDYLQLMSAARHSDQTNRVGEITEISRSLKGLAKELRVPVVALSQLNRDLERRENKKPIMADLRESGSIEQDADVILFIYRDEVYHPESSEHGTAEIIIAKQRNGPIGHVKLAFRGELTRFDNLALYGEEAYYPAPPENDNVPGAMPRRRSKPRPPQAN